MTSETPETFESSPETDRQLRLPLPGLLSPPQKGASIPRTERVFANRNLHFAQIDWVGFDMDYTLAIYRQAEMDALSVELTVEKLIQKGYPEDLRQLKFDARFPIRGLVVDKAFGNILKMDRHKAVAKGYHGTRLLPKSELEVLYHREKIQPTSSRFHWIDTLFALCEVTSYAALVSALEESKRSFDPEQLFHDVRASIDMAHGDGSVYQHVIANLPRYIERDPELGPTLHKLRSSGKKIFLLTNSPYSYTNTVMSYLLAPEGSAARYQGWENYFDVAICAAKKPRWFGEGTPFLERAGDETFPASGRLEKGKIYEGGGLKDFEQRMSISGSKVLYVGDHIYGDILRSKKDSSWRTAMIIQELDQETTALEQTAALRARRRQLAEARPLMEDELRYYQQKHKELSKGEGREASQLRAQAKDQIDRLRAELGQLEEEYELTCQKHDQVFHPYFGSLLKEMNGLSIFGQQVDLYADIYMRRVSCLGGYSPTHFFRSPHDLMPHEL